MSAAETALPARGADRPLPGVLLMLGFCALAPLADSLAKILGGSVPLLQLLLIRFLIQAAILSPLVLRGRARMRISARVVRLTVLRTFLHIAGVGAMFSALRVLPLADAVAIAFVMPFILLLLGRFVSAEAVGPRRLAACCVGFAGTMMVVQPGFAEFGAPALLPLAVAFFFALFMMMTRKIAKDVEPIALQWLSGLVAALILGALWLATNGLHPDFAIGPLTGREMTLLVAIGVIGTLAHLLMTWSLRFAPAATLAPMQYLEIPFATLCGWVIFSDFPDGLALAGIVVTTAAGLYVILRERKTGRLASPPAA